MLDVHTGSFPNDLFKYILNIQYENVVICVLVSKWQWFYKYKLKRNITRKEMFYLMTHSTNFIYGYMASDIWLRTILIVRKDTHCRHIGYSFRLTTMVILYDHPTDRIAHTTAFDIPVVEHWLEREIAQWVHPMKDRPDDPLHHERTLLPWSYISLRNITNVM